MGQVTSSLRDTSPYSNYTEITDTINFYRLKLNNQLRIMRAKFPLLPGNNVRFTQAELETLTARTFEIIKSFVIKRHQESIFRKLEIK